jgi:hypothetical protein
MTRLFLEIKPTEIKKYFKNEYRFILEGSHNFEDSGMDVAAVEPRCRGPISAVVMCQLSNSGPEERPV